jgi:Methylamine utilisation protein MauE
MSALLRRMTARVPAVTRRTFQIFIALVLLSTALGKLLDIPGFAEVVGTYQFFPRWAYLPVAVVIPLAEVFLGVWLLSGRALWLSGLASVGMHAAYMGWSSLAMLRGLHLSNCGCFGVFLSRPLSAATVIEDLVMVAVSAGLVLLAWPRSASQREAVRSLFQSLSSPKQAA